MQQVSIVLGVIGSDCHAVGNKILERVFTDAGFKVINLGVMVSQEEFIAAAIETGVPVQLHTEATDDLSSVGAWAEAVGLLGHYITIGTVIRMFDVKPPEGSKTF